MTKPIVTTVARAGMIGLTRAVFTVFADWEVTGTERVPASGPLLVVANHLNLADPALISAVLGRDVAFMAKEELFRGGLGWIVRSYGAFRVRRGEADREALREAVRLLKVGEAVGMFPEGTRARGGGMGRGMPGVGLIARLSGAPVLPIGLSGTDAVRGFKIVVDHPRVAVAIGEPYVPVVPAGSRDKAQAIADDIMERVAALLPEDYRGVYADSGQRGRR